MADERDPDRDNDEMGNSNEENIVVDSADDEFEDADDADDDSDDADDTEDLES